MQVKHILFLVFFCNGYMRVSAQNEVCNPTTEVDTGGYAGVAFFNYASTSKTKSQRYQTAFGLGQVFTGYVDNSSYNSTVGFYGRYLLPPFGLKVEATQGDLLDRIQLTWETDALGPLSTEGFNIYRDGIFLATVGPNIRNYNDFNVIAGVAYQYSVRGVNAYGEGAESFALGFQVPNGVVTGWIRTTNGNPVQNAVVTLMPMQGFSARFGESDQAFAAISGDSTYIPENGDWSLTFWSKTASASNNGKIISIGEILLYIRAINSSSGNEGIEVANLPNAAPFLSAIFPDSIKNDWNHVALTYESETQLLKIFINGILINQAVFINSATQGETIGGEVFLKFGNTGEAGGWNGKIDEFRIYHQLLGELDLPEIMHGTASSQTENLAYYWKMDEELGNKSYDVINRLKLFFCGASFDGDRPPVRTAGKTNDEGYYRIESASYGTGTTFLAQPSKSFYLHKSVKLNRAESGQISIPDFPLPKKSTIEVWINNSGSTGIQTILSKKSQNNDLKLFLEPSGFNQTLKLTLNGSTQAFGILGNGFQHIAITIDSLSNAVQVFRNGVSAGTQTFPGNLGNLSDPSRPWRLGVYDTGSSLTDYYNGLIDEFAVYDTILSPAQINNHFSMTRDMQERGLYVYYPMDEGAGNIISNVGSYFLTNGTLTNHEWSSFAANQIEQPHIFGPKTRQVTLNPSVTSVDQVDFTDRSTVAVSGYVRYKDTDCFAPNVEILVNNQSFNPAVFTDSTGKFVIDFEPGFSGILKPVFEDHTFLPATAQIVNVTSPRAGILFTDQKQSTIKGQVAGNNICKKSIIEADEIVRVKVASVDGCFERIVNIEEQDGIFSIPNLPPLEQMTVTIIHSNPFYQKKLNDLGGATVDISVRDTTIEFICFVEPEIVIESGLEPYPGCDVIVLDQYERKELGIRLTEQYVPTETDDGVCFLDSANIRILNGFADEVKDTTLSNGFLLYKYVVGAPNPSPPYLKTLQIISTTLENNTGEKTAQGIVTGIFNKLPAFTTQLPETPTMVVHDPPGDGSYSFIEKGQKVCQTMKISTKTSGGQSMKNSFDFGLDSKIFPFFGLPSIEYESELGPAFTLTTSIGKTSETSLEVCNTLNQRLSTSEDEAVVGAQGGDVFMGGGLNLNFSLADVVYFDTTACQAFDTSTVAIQPGQYATTFIYSEFEIINSVLPNLNRLKQKATDTTQISSYQNSIDRWNTILSDNSKKKAGSKVLKNISFDAGASYESSESVDSAKAESISNEGSIGFDQEFKIKIKAAGIGGGIESKISFSDVTSRSADKNNSKGITTGYVLKDNDPLDAFSVDIALDSVYKTPIFNLRAGQSSCPWEEGTANREYPNLQIAEGSSFSQVDVPANKPAVFQLRLGNLSATNEDWTYGFASIAANNPNGAIIKLNGYPINSTQKFIVPYGTSQLVTLTIEKGPKEYEYDSLLVALYSECEFERNLALSLPLDRDDKFFSPIYLNAHFIRPCSEVVLNSPNQNWVVYPGALNGDTIPITVSGYNRDGDFKLIRVQYRRSDGDGNWINIPTGSEKYNPFWSQRNTLTEPYDTLDARNYDIFYFNTAGLEDDEYEIRALTVCSGDAFDKPGYSEIIKGKIDRQPPSLVGVPQPSDGVYHVGDEISFTFNQDINCNELIPTSALLFNSETGLEIGSKWTCVGNKIVIEPIDINKEFENKIIRAELQNIQDLTGNIMTSAEWEFYVDRNELAWLTDSLEIVKYVDETKTITAKIHNRGGYPVPYSIINIPEWLHVSPNRGTLVANEIEEIKFTVKDNLGLGEIADNIVLRTETGVNPFFMGGDEPLNIKARNLCRPESWVLNPDGFNTADYTFSMNFVVQLDIEGAMSADENDIVGAYVGNQLRGIAQLKYNAGINKYMAFLTVYSNQNSGEQIKFQIWDASECKLYAYALETFSFLADDVKGTIDTCVVLHTNTTLLSKIFIHPGWNWISMNLDLTPNTTNAALASMNSPQGGLIKDQTSFSAYSQIAMGWVGSLNQLVPTSLYQLTALNKDSLSIVGLYIDPTTRNIPLNTGWNWIGYIPTQSLSVNDALASINASTGDIIKSQTQFAQYKSGAGWIGNLEYMSAPNGYLLKVANAGSLTYPDPFNVNLKAPDQVDLAANNNVPRSAIHQFSEENQLAFWTVDPTKYEYSMNIIATVVEDKNGKNVLHDGDEVGAFVDGEIRGVGKAIHIENSNSYVIFMTVYANVEGEKLSFRYFDASANVDVDVLEKYDFRINKIIGQVDQPEELHISGTTSIDDLSSDSAIKIFPNPFTNQMQVTYSSPKSQDIRLSIQDVNGKLVDVKSLKAKTGLNTYEWQPVSGLSGGVYLVFIEGSEGKFSQKVLYVK